MPATAILKTSGWLIEGDNILEASLGSAKRTVNGDFVSASAPERYIWSLSGTLARGLRAWNGGYVPSRAVGESVRFVVNGVL